MSRSKFVRDEIKFRHEVMVAKSSGREVTMHLTGTINWNFEKNLTEEYTDLFTENAIHFDFWSKTIFKIWNLFRSMTIRGSMFRVI